MNNSPISHSLWRRDLARSEVIAGAAWAGGMLAVSLIAVALRRLDYIDPDTTTRVLIGGNGLMMAWYGNRMPKAFVPGAQARRVRRVAAWSLVISGLIYAGLWAFAPREVALVGGMGVVVAGMVVTFGYCLTLRGQARAA